MLKRLGQDENDTAPVLHSALVRLKLVRLNIVRLILYLLRMRRRRYTQPILKRKVEKVTKYDRDYIWGLVQDQFRREGFLKQPVKLL